MCDSRDFLPFSGHGRNKDMADGNMREMGSKNKVSGQRGPKAKERGQTGKYSCTIVE
jgi:hypothetical protein